MSTVPSRLRVGVALLAATALACRAEPAARAPAGAPAGDAVRASTGPGMRHVAGGDAERGEVLLHAYGCGACHVIPGVLAARGESGPPLDAYAERVFIAGALPNSAENLIAWIVDPQRIEPGTAMPNLGVREAQARDMAAYLYTLRRGPQWRLPRALRRPPEDGAWRTVGR